MTTKAPEFIRTVAIHQMCGCGHSEAAHLEPGSGCAFCACRRFRFDRIEQDFEGVRAIQQAGLHAGARLVGLTGIATSLGVSERAVRRAARKNGIPMIDGKIETRHITALERLFRRRPTPLEAERTSFEDGQARTSGCGRTVSEPAAFGLARADPARRAEIEAMARILDPLASEHRLLPERLPHSRHQAARLAERRALDDILKPRPAGPPERSL